jgi:hypothetical protein
LSRTDLPWALLGATTALLLRHLIVTAYRGLSPTRPPEASPPPRIVRGVGTFLADADRRQAALGVVASNGSVAHDLTRLVESAEQQAHFEGRGDVAAAIGALGDARWVDSVLRRIDGVFADEFDLRELEAIVPVVRAMTDPLSRVANCCARRSRIVEQSLEKLITAAGREALRKSHKVDTTGTPTDDAGLPVPAGRQTMLPRPARRPS